MWFHCFLWWWPCRPDRSSRNERLRCISVRARQWKLLICCGTICVRGFFDKWSISVTVSFRMCHVWIKKCLVRFLCIISLREFFVWLLSRASWLTWHTCSGFDVPASLPDASLGDGTIELNSLIKHVWSNFGDHFLNRSQLNSSKTARPSSDPHSI